MKTNLMTLKLFYKLLYICNIIGMMVITLMHYGCMGKKSISTSYIILTNIPESDSYYKTVAKLKEYRNAEILTFEPEKVETIKSILIKKKPDYAAIILKPIDLDINFVRKFVMLSTEIDDDPFSDFSFGFITGATSDDALKFVENIIKAEKEGIQELLLTVSGYSASSINYVEESDTFFLSLLPIKSYSNIYLEVGDPDVMKFFFQNAEKLKNKKLLDIGHNGDPHMLWLFEGSNMVSDTWNYDPKLVENPPIKRLGLRSDDIRTLDLYPAVAFNGACHSGVVKKAIIESDILATFGDTKGVIRFYEMSDNFSFALSILKTGITGYFAPIGSNNANDQQEEIYNVFLYNEPLGDIHKRNIDGVVMGFLGNKPKLQIFKDGDLFYEYETLPSGTYKPSDFGWASSTMLSGKANRIYYGDPLYNPFLKDKSDKLKLVSTKISKVTESSLQLDISFKKSNTYFPLWDKFHDNGIRLYTTVDLPKDYKPGVSVKVLNASGEYSRVINAIEQHRGKVILHFEVHIPDKDLHYLTKEINFNISLLIKKN